MIFGGSHKFIRLQKSKFKKNEKENEGESFRDMRKKHSDREAYRLLKAEKKYGKWL